MFEKFLPFAMALGVEKNWSKAFQNIYTQPPNWYQGGRFGPPFFAYGFVTISTPCLLKPERFSLPLHAVLEAPASAVGGGFSGGGFGGGGGGGF